MNQPKRGGTTFTNYQEEAKRKRTIKKLVNKINMVNPSSAKHHIQPKEKHLPVNGQYKLSVKGNEKIFLPIYEVLNQARLDQASNKEDKESLKKTNYNCKKNLSS